jgi:hypothetical protein
MAEVRPALAAAACVPGAFRFGGIVAAPGTDASILGIFQSANNSASHHSQLQVQARSETSDRGGVAGRQVDGKEGGKKMQLAHGMVMASLINYTSTGV